MNKPMECALCSGESRLMARYLTDGSYNYWIECRKCGMVGPLKHDGREAIAAWNELVKDLIREMKTATNCCEAMSATDELLRLLDERDVEYEAFMDIKNRRITKWRTYHGAFVFFAVEKEGKLFVETTSDTEHSAICTPEQAIAATLGGDEEYESRMDELLCRLTNGKLSKSRAYSVDFMVECVDETYGYAAP